MVAPVCPIVWLEDAQTLHEVAQNWRNAEVLAIDTEFMRTDTYFPIPALIQISDGDTNWLIDPLVVPDLAPLKAVLCDAGTVKVMHACTEDIEVFLRLFGEVPVTVFDTQIAAALCGYGFNRGYAALVEKLLEKILPKEETRSDWLARPLTEAQAEYAACDVEFLYSLYRVLQAQLRQDEREAWVFEESALLVAQVKKMQAPELAYTKFKAAWRLPARNLAALMHLALWREKTAKQKDLPRGRIIDSKSLFTVAQSLPKHVAQLRQIETLKDSAIRRYGQRVIDIVQGVVALGQSELPEPVVHPSREMQKQLKALRAVVDQLAQAHNIAPEVLASRRDLEALLATDARPLPATVTGWRAPLLEQAMNQYYETIAV